MNILSGMEEASVDNKHVLAAEIIHSQKFFLKSDPGKNKDPGRGLNFPEGGPTSINSRDLCMKVEEKGENKERATAGRGPSRLMSCPSLLMSNPLRTLKRLKRFASCALERLLLKMGTTVDDFHSCQGNL